MNADGSFQFPLRTGGIPPRLGSTGVYYVVSDKISCYQQIYDAGEYFSIVKDDSGTWHVLVTNDSGLEVSDSNGYDI